MTRDDLAARIVRAMRARGCIIDSGEGEVMPVAVENCFPDGRYNPINETDKDRFGDARFLIVHRGGKPHVLGAWYCTTQPGPRLVNTPIKAARAKGAASIEHGQTGPVYKLDTHRGNYPHRGLCQRAGAVTVSRDKNKDFKREGDERTSSPDSGINWHDARMGDDVNPVTVRIGGWSAGCNVTPRIKDQAAFVRGLESDPRWIKNHDFCWRTTTIPYEWLTQSEPALPKPKPKQVGIWGAVAAFFLMIGAFIAEHPWWTAGFALALIVCLLVAVVVKEAKEM